MKALILFGAFVLISRPICQKNGDRTMESCPFCKIEAEDILFETASFIVIRDRYPVTPGHRLIISRSHVRTYFDLPREVQNELPELIKEMYTDIQKNENNVTGLNVGWNAGESAGQTVPHCHIHLIPRRDGDMQDPRGGVRGVIPDKQKY